MTEINGMFISFPSDYTLEERQLILDAFHMTNTDTIEKKGFGQFVDLIMTSPGDGSGYLCYRSHRHRNFKKARW